MENKNNYPNKWKDGWSSADHAKESYSPYANERAQREAMVESEERRRTESQYQSGWNRQQGISKHEIEQAKEDLIMARKEIEDREQEDQRREAVKIIVQQKKAEYNKKSWFGKAIATLRGKSFDKMKKQITESAERRVDGMAPEQLEFFIESYTEKEGRHR